MPFVQPSTCDGMNSEFDLWAPRPTQGSVVSNRCETYNPVASISDGGPVEFRITNADPDTYLDLGNTLLYVKAKIVKGDGSDLKVEDQVAPVNLWLHSLWQQVDISLNDKLVSASTNMYPYRAYIETLLSYGGEAKDSQLATALWFKDRAGQFNANDGQNPGFVHRMRHTLNSQSVDLLGRLHTDIGFQDRYLLNHVTVRVRLTRAKDVFSLITQLQEPQPEYKVVLQDVQMHVRKVQLSPPLQLAHVKVLEKAPAQYPIRRVLTKYFAVPQGQTAVNEQNLFLGVLPKRLILGMVDNTAFDGTYGENPFQFQHMNLNYLALHMNGRQIPSQPLTPRFDDNLYVRSYFNLFTGVGKAYRDDGNDISRHDFPRGYTLFCFDLSPNLHSDAEFIPVQKGDLRLEMKFQTPLAKTINVICYAEFDNVIEVDRNRQILCDFQT